MNDSDALQPRKNGRRVMTVLMWVVILPVIAGILSPLRNAFLNHFIASKGTGAIRAERTRLSVCLRFHSRSRCGSTLRFAEASQPEQQGYRLRFEDDSSLLVLAVFHLASPGMPLLIHQPR